MRNDFYKIPSVSTAVLLFLFLPVFFVSADPFTSGNNTKSIPAASRSPLVHLPEYLINLQLSFREKAGELLTTFKKHQTVSTVSLFLFIVFIYGFLHGAGPGHRKTVVFTLFLSRKAKRWEPFAAGFLSAGLHAGTSLLLILVFKVIKQTIASFTSSEQLAFYLEGWTFILLSFFALFLLIYKITKIKRQRNEHTLLVSNRNIYALLFISSLFPCPGATMILLFALSQDLITLGIFGILSMSLGMGTIISLVGYLAMTGREKLFLWFKNREDKARSFSNRLELISYMLVALFALWMGSPFIHWIITSS